MKEKEYKCPCGVKTNYGIHYYKDGLSNGYMIYSCDSPAGCFAAENVKHCPYCGEEIKDNINNNI